MGDPRWVLAVDHGTSTTTGATADVDPADGWTRVATVRVDGEAALPSIVLSRTDGTVLAGRPALDAAHAEPQAAVLRGRSYLAAATGGSDDPLLATWPRPTTAVNVATALVARVLQAETGRRGTAPAALALLHPASWTDPDTGPAALRAAGRSALGAVAEGDDVEVALLAAPEAAAIRLGGSGPVVVADLGGGGTEVALVDREAPDPATTTATLREGVPARTVEGGAESLDDALTQLVLDRAPAALAERIRFSSDVEAHRAWFWLRRGVHDAKSRLGTEGFVDVGVPVLPPEHPAPGVVRLTHADLGPLFAPALEQVGAAVVGLLDDADAGRPPLLVRGGVAELPGVRDWLVARTGCVLAAADDPGASAPSGQVCGAAAWAAARAGLGR
jgi:molecular chaperone DnaK (HSP70)